jgi:hypothetical protein
MKNNPWDKLAAVIEQARTGEQASFHWPSYSERRFWTWVEWNGGLPIISVHDHKTGEDFNDLSAFKALDLLESVQ